MNYVIKNESFHSCVSRIIVEEFPSHFVAHIFVAFQKERKV